MIAPKQGKRPKTGDKTTAKPIYKPVAGARPATQTNDKMIAPKDCTSMDEIREAIDSLDKQIIGLLGVRFLYAKEIVKFKFDEEGIIAKDRYSAVMQKVRNLGEENGLSPDVVEQVYKTLVHYFIDEELKILHARQSAEKQAGVV